MTRPASLLAAAGLVLGVAGCGTTGEPGSAPGRTQLSVTLRPAGETGATHRWTLRCDPPRGDHPDPAAACAALDALEHPFAEASADDACAQIHGGPASARVTGTFAGAGVDTSFARRNGCEIDRWSRHEPLLDPDRQAADPAAADAAPKSDTCSASELGAEPVPDQELPPRVRAKRADIVAAARACDFSRLQELALAAPDGADAGFTFSYAAGRTPGAYWHAAEARGEPVLARLVQVLSLTPAREPSGLHVWPAVHAAGAGDDAWREVAQLYSPAEIARMRAGDGYLGYRVGIGEDGDWQFFVAGD
jgi:hypothetical protein